MSEGSTKRDSNALSPAAEINVAPEKQMYTTWPDMIRHWPKTTFCIVSNEFCERFSYYGMRTVLTFYVLNVLKFSDNAATMFFNGFAVLCYATPMLGSIIADGYIGKFWTIFSVSIIYAAGQVVLALASTKKQGASIHPWLDITGLLIIAFGTGGIKPCVASFGGDQFELGQERMLSLFFSMFYFSINAGSMISTFISPIFRSMPCMGQDSCYPMAFGIPACLMILATCVFMAGSFWYKKPKPTMNVFGEVARVIGRAIANKSHSNESLPHWLDHYMDNHCCEHDNFCQKLRIEKRNKKACQKIGFIDDVKSLFRVLIMFLPVPMFWALYDQQGSIWLIQGIQMDCKITSGGLLLLPDQMQTLNAVLILVFIPIFQIIIYPLCSLCIELTPLRKMVAGGFLASAAFLITGFVQLQVNTSLPSLPGSNEAFLSVWNIAKNGCDVSVSMNAQTHKLTYQEYLHLYDDKEKNVPSNYYTIHDASKPPSMSFDFTGACPDFASNKPKFNVTIPKLEGGKIYYIAVTPDGILNPTMVKPDKPTEGTGESAYSILSLTYNQNFAYCRVDGVTATDGYLCDPKRPSDFFYWERAYDYGTDDIIENVVYAPGAGSGNAYSYDFKAVRPGKWHLYKMGTYLAKSVTQKTKGREAINSSLSETGQGDEITSQGGVYVIAVIDDNNTKKIEYFQVVSSNKVNILWQVPQIVVITAAEILFSITGYEFAYSQSAPSMKALVQALWLFTTSIGDSIIVLITALNLFSNMATEFFVYAALLSVRHFMAYGHAVMSSKISININLF
ncbi:hypothetical protein WR25_12590 [Diploscapter pachys]|uniref:Oligopeptide transporter 1 n=1 Tax=Diploscapter pachys TaxID=2018661 RepID=A0A2A2KNY1_9BILA|nr:hypothetical protein WR25_12590 [Diploscapter pachys]